MTSVKFDPRAKERDPPNMTEVCHNNNNWVTEPTIDKP